MLKVKRAYDEKEATDGKRILIDRLWPRGISKTEAHIDDWLKDLAPSAELRRWFGHDPRKWGEFKKKYVKELSSPDKAKLIEDIIQRAKHETITLVYSARDTEHNDARVLEELIRQNIEKIPQ